VVAEKEMLKICASFSKVSQIFPHFILMSTEKEICCPVFAKCGDP